jgi:hypothetical protein
MKRFDFLSALGLFIASFILYVRTLAPSLLFGDSAEFQTIAYTLGIGHPTGYPVYILLAKVFTFIPVHDVAYRVNLFSAFCAALTVALVYLVLRKLGGKIVPAMYGALALMLVPLFWKHAAIAEIYTPSAACLAFILFAVLTWKETNNPRWLFVAGLFGGLSLGIHTTIALAAPAVIVYLILTFYFPLSTHKEGRKNLFSSIYGATLGILLFLSSFLFLDSLNSPAGYYNTVVYPSLSVWDMTPADFDSPFERLAFLYFPPQFKGQFFNAPLDEAWSRIMDFVEQASWSLWLALFGLISLFLPRKDSPARWQEAVLLILSFIAFLVFAATYNVYDYYIYFIPAIVILAIFIGLGVNAIVEMIASIPRLPKLVPIGLGVAILAMGFYPSIEEVASHWRERVPPGLEGWEHSFFEYPDARRLEAEEIVNSLEDNAIVFTDWDQAYSFYYAAHVLQGRTGISFHETYPQEGVFQLADSAIAYIEASIDSRPIYFSERPTQLANQFKITRTGSGLFRIERK